MAETRFVCLAGNPNVGKSTLFNALTGLRQHTGNWTGKTVDPARGSWMLEGRRYQAVDLPGIYSLAGGTPEERVAANYLEETEPDCLVVILDATALERSLRLALELRGGSDRLLICLNLMDEAQRLGLQPNAGVLARALQAPVVCTRLDRRQTAEDLRRAVAAVCGCAPFPAAAILPDRSRNEEEARQAFALPPGPESERIRLKQAEAIAALACPRVSPNKRRDWDRLVLNRWLAYPLVLLLLFGILWLTVRGANLPSQALQLLFRRLGLWLERRLSGLPDLLRRLLLEGIYGTTATVVAVMLPPMAIFFPLFTLLEDLGWLPRVALLLDRPFARAGTCGRQGLTLCMGCGCNAVGVTGCRILPGEKQRLAAIVTNALVPCNGRFPTLILLSTLLLSRGGAASPFAAAAWLTGLIALSVAVTLGVTGLLRRTLLRGAEGRFSLELPPFRRPELGQVLIRSVLDRTLHVLGRAVTVAAPAGALIWLLANVQTAGRPLLTRLALGLDPPAALLGLTGPLLLAFLLSFPANELLLPLTVLIVTAGGSLQTGLGDSQLLAVLVGHGLNPGTALCASLFCLFHWPCSTTLMTVYRETSSLKWTLRALWIPTLTGVCICAAVRLVLNLAGVL